jgi:3-methyl-2-oxobutanoate hydroxymethyltransferase
MKTTTHSLKEMKTTGKKITVLTAYDHPTASILDESGIDIVLVGDSVGNVVLGYENTIPVTMEEMLHHTKAVVRGVENAMVIADMPFMSYQLNPEDALRNASRFIKEAGASGVKVEGTAHLDAIKKIIDAGIPVMGHIGFTPQSVNQIGGYRVQGRALDEAKALMEGAKDLEKTGVFSLVIEMVPAVLASKVSRSLNIPVIGCGAGPECDGQVLVISDILGLSGKTVPKFAKKYSDLSAETKRAVSNYISDVRSGRFPGNEHSF